MAMVGYLIIQAFYVNAALTYHHISAKPGDSYAVIQRQRVWECNASAYARGVRPGQNIREAQLACPDLHVLPYTSDHYEESARAIWDVCAQVSPAVEPTAYHAAFLDLTPTPNPEAVATELLTQLGSLGWQGWVGLAPNKLIARMAGEALAARGTSEPRPSNSPRVTRVKDVPKFLASRPIQALWPLPEKVLAHLTSLSIRTVGELARIPEKVLVQQLGAQGRLVAGWAQGLDNSAVQVRYPPPRLVVVWSVEGGFTLQVQGAIRGNRTFHPVSVPPSPVAWDGNQTAFLAHEEAVQHALTHACTLLATTLRNAGWACQGLDLTLQPILAAAKRTTGMTFKAPTADEKTLLRHAWRLWRLVNPGAPVQAFTLRSQSLQPTQAAQLDLFGAQAARQRDIELVLHAVCSRFGEGALFRATQLPVSRRERLRALWAGNVL